MALEPSLKSIQTENSTVEKELDELVDQLPQWRQKRDLPMSVSGVGEMMAYTLFSELAEIGKLNRKENTALVGVAPMNNEISS